MTVSTATSRVDYTGNGVTTVFAVPFPFIEDSYLTVIRTVVATGVETTLTLNSGGADGYTVSGAGQPVGSVTVVTAPTGAQRLSIIRAVPGTQEADFVANDPFPAETFEDSLDKLQMQINDNATRASRSPVLYDSDIDGSGRYNFKGNRGSNAADGVSATDLATVQQITSAGSGSFVQAGAGSVIRTMQDKARDIVSVKDFGAKGDGVADDTAAFQAALNNATGAAVLIPKGRYRITSTITLPGSYTDAIASVSPVLMGEGESSVLVHAFDGKLFNCAASNPSHMEFRDFNIASSGLKSAGSVAFHFAGGLNKSLFSDIRYGGATNTTTDYPSGFFDCLNTSTIDEVEFRNVFLYGVKTRGYGIGQGSSVWFVGGRVVGNGTASALGTGTGIQLYGGNGGVWVFGVDLIQLGTGLYVSKANLVSNREVFISQAAFDSCNIGLSCEDDAYIDVQGVWAASCEAACINCLTGYNGVLTLDGGTIFNGGVLLLGGAGDGIVINSALSVDINGVIVRNNKGTGVRCPAAAQPQRATISDCRIYSNATGVSCGGTMQINDNWFYSNTTAHIVENTATVGIRGNAGVNDQFNILTPPAIPASSVAYTYNGNYEVDVYVRSGTVSAVFLNGNPLYETTNVCVRMRKGDQISLTYTAAPAWQWVRR